MNGKWTGKLIMAVVLLTSGLLRADDAVKLGRFQPSPGGFGELVRSAAAAESRDSNPPDDTELAFFGRHRYWRGFSAGYAAGAWGHGWSVYYRPYAVSYYRPFYPVGFYRPFVYTYGYPAYVGYSSFHYGYGSWGGGFGWCGISSTSAPTITLGSQPGISPTHQQTVPQSVPPVPPVAPEAPRSIPLTEDEPRAIPVSFPSRQPAGTKPVYKYPAYGDKK